MNEHEIQRVAAAAHALRPDWPIASLRTLITDKLADRPRRDVAVALAWVACEADSKTPARVLEAGPWWKAVGGWELGSAPRPLKPSEACRNCGQAKHAPHAECDGRPPMRTADVSAPVAHLRALRDEATAELCSHHVPPGNCIDCRKSTKSEPEETT